MSKTERRPRLTTARKFELYLATRSADAPLGEILRQYGVHLDDLRAIERVVESSALAGLKAQSRQGRPTYLVYRLTSADLLPLLPQLVTIARLYVSRARARP